MIPKIPIAIGIGAIIVGTSLAAFISHLRNVSINEGYEKTSEEFNKKYKDQYE